ncbi:STAS domain-containing protein [Lentzea albidocapillata]|uniref:Anti-sigma factor antagonist n=1 Tax=Lentzea albidocapillata TaxID=40571 RepID=A0A1W2F7S0_9PSEU|nr:STAS domain-containing protein [Lentzea albidocapillata]SMD17990.1 anti-anti-sigma factor [Lentzea albidocapillata]
MSKLNPNLLATVRTVDTGHATVVSIAGEVDMTTEQLVWTAIRAQLATPRGLLILDLTGVAFMASAGLRLLLQSQNAAARRGTRLAIVPSAAVRRPLAVAGIDRVLDLYPDVRSVPRTA